MRDLIGERFGRLIVIGREPDITLNNGKNSRVWKCKCDCGNTVISREALILYGKKKSCGCLYKDTRSIYGKSNKTHGESRDRLYRIWSGMIQRCANENGDSYKYYGEKGISVCEEWESYEEFSRWSHSNGYDKSKTIDRIDTDRDYGPDNCRWVSWKEQENNRSNNINIEFNGKTQTLSQWCEELNIPYQRVWNRLFRLNWDVDRAFAT